MKRLPSETSARLSLTDRIEFIAQLWDSIDEGAIPLTDAQHDELARRLAAEADEPEDAIAWEQIEAELLARYA